MHIDSLIRDEFRLRNDIHHLNHAAVAPWPERTRRAVAEFASENAEQGSLDYLRWLETEATLRARAARLLNAASAEDIALLKSTSEALSVVAHGLDWEAGDNVVISDQEFPSNRIVWESLAAYGVQVREARLDAAESPEAALLEITDQRTRVLAISSVQYASGLRVHLDVLGAACRERGILFCVDAIQSIGALRTDVQAIEADFVMADGHKWMLGPEGVALFYSRPESRDRLTLRQYGWHMVEYPHDFARRDWQPARSARRFECGSPNTLGIHALDASLSLLLDAGMETVEKRVLGGAAHLLQGIHASPHLAPITSAERDRHAGIVTFRHRRADAESLHRHLVQGGVLCAQRGGGVRFSPHFYTARGVLDYALDLAENCPV